MFDKVYLKDYILDYPKVKCILSKLLNNYSGKITCNVLVQLIFYMILHRIK